MVTAAIHIVLSRFEPFLSSPIWTYSIREIHIHSDIVDTVHAEIQNIHQFLHGYLM